METTIVFQQCGIELKCAVQAVDSDFDSEGVLIPGVYKAVILQEEE
jgi:hypothetical protein